ncbi:MAG: glycoside hydrolase domain-containing protein, partial [Solirubrobacteraceae bacterium]
PRSWPIFDLARDPHACVRFDRHALYLGTPSREERCPAHAVGRTEAILISPLKSAKGAPSATAAGLRLEGNATSFAVRPAGVDVTATWSRAPRLVSQALGRRSSRSMRRERAAGSPATPSPQALTSLQQTRSVRRASVYTGLGFDTCSVPSSHQMAAWFASLYRAVAIQVGGVNASCAQPNLTKRWVSHEIAAGWHPFPTYAGLQAPHNRCGCAGISTNTGQANSQGWAAAAAAVAHAQRLGIRARNPVYFDMEGYATGGVNTPAVLAFLSGWTSRLHAAGYVSGVYSSASSGISDLVKKHGTGYAEPNDIWIADWNGRKTTSDPYVPRGDWAHHHRLHQYRGNSTETYGRVTLTVDDDYLNGATAKTRDGHLLLTSSGGVHPYGVAKSYGSDAARMSRGVSGVALVKDRKTGGYWILKSNGGVDTFHAPWYGSLRRKLHGSRPVAIAEAPRGGYLILTSNGGVHPFDAAWHGSKAGFLSPGVTAVGLAIDREAGGYWLLKSNGGVDNFDAPYDGSLKNTLAGVRANGLAARKHGGYFVLTSDGGVHPFGAARFDGSDAGKLSSGVSAVSLATSPTVTGYRVLRSHGGVDCFDATWFGSLNRRMPAGARVVSIAAAIR